MEINAANVAWHKCFFLWEARLRRQKGEKKIGELSTDEIQEITDNAIPVTTKKPHKVRSEKNQRNVPV